MYSKENKSFILNEKLMFTEATEHYFPKKKYRK